MIKEETYLEMKKLIADYENEQSNKNNIINHIEQPYLYITVVVTKRKYNPNYGDDKECKCGHPYHRHFDSYENMSIAGCKYCDCYTFKEI